VVSAPAGGSCRSTRHVPTIGCVVDGTGAHSAAHPMTTLEPIKARIKLE
jgi:hypothetical protein